MRNLVITLSILLCPIWAPVLAEESFFIQEKEILSILEVQETSWNLGDLEGFMKTYLESENLTYFSGNKIIRGWKAARERYRSIYQDGDNEMGELRFHQVELRMLGLESALLQGRWSLDRKKSGDLDGVFTLVVKKFPEGWKIVHDHSSSN